MRRFRLDGFAALLALALCMTIGARAQDEDGTRAVVSLQPQQTEVLQDIGDQLGRDHSFALVIGISSFDHLPHLKGVDPEAESVAEAFKNQGFQVERIGGRLTKEQLKGRVAQFLETHGRKAENRLIIYFASHGYSAQDRRDYGFLAASDTVRPGRPGFEASAYSVRELSAALTGIAAQHIFLFFDSCFSGSMVPDPTRDAGNTLLAGKPEKALSPEVANWTLDLLSHNARLVLTAGSDSQTVPDVDNPYARAVVDGLSGQADADGDGLILGTELAQFVRGRVARETRRKGKANDAVFAVLPKIAPPSDQRPDAPPHIDYALQGDFVFLSPLPPSKSAVEGNDEMAEILAARARRLPGGQFVECADCSTMVEMPGRKMALSRTEVTYAEWDACYREFGCRRYLPDDGRGRGDRPAAGVTWQDALEFSLWMNGKRADRCSAYRLPTKAEWLAAAQMDTTSVGTVAEGGGAVCSGCGPGRDEGQALPVASLPANTLGLNDLEGNLWEWVDDGPACTFADLREKGSCAGDGTVMGGSFATAASRLVGDLEGHLPRTSNEWPWSWPTVGLRVACDLK